MKTALLALALLLQLPAAAAEEPEVTYARYHRGILYGNVDEMMRHAADAKRNELGALSPAQRAAAVKMMAVMVPNSYVLRAKDIDGDGNGARLVLNGIAQASGADKPETMYGTIRMVMQRGEWRVASSEWNSRQPSLAPPPAAAKAAKAAKAPEKAAPPPKGSPPVIGSMDAAPERKLGTAKEPCVFKPVMTAEDLENCK